jgi:hypothetical protein
MLGKIEVSKLSAGFEVCNSEAEAMDWFRKVV